MRFHSYQCLLLTVAALGVSTFSAVASVMLPVQALLASLLNIVLIVGWAVAANAAWRGQRLQLPIIGPIAARRAERS